MKLNKVFKWCMVVLIAISVGLLVWGFLDNFRDKSVEALIYWAYIMVGIGIVAWVVIGGIISATTNPKFLIKVGIGLVAIAAICFVAYLLAPAQAAFGREGLDSFTTLKLTDTILNLTYFTGAGAIIAIIIGEIRLAIANKK